MKTKIISKYHHTSNIMDEASYNYIVIFSKHCIGVFNHQYRPALLIISFTMGLQSIASI